MQHRIGIVLQLAVSLFTGVLPGPGASPQGNAPPSLQEQLEAQYQVTKKSGNAVVPGTVLVLLKDGVIGVPLSNPRSLVTKLQNGTLHAPSASALAQFGRDIRILPKDEKVFITKIDVNLIEDWVTLHIVECGACNAAVPANSYKSVVGFQFTKGALKKASVPDVEDTIAQVFDIYTPPVTPPAPTQEPLVPTAAAPGQGLTNNDILKLVAVKLPDSIILSKIQSSACAFDTSTDEIVRLKQAGVSDAILQAMVNAGTQPSAAPPPVPGPEPGACADYTSCTQGAITAMSGSQWDQALANLQQATGLDPSNPGAWHLLGNVYLATERYAEATPMWDKVLALGGTLVFPMCHERLNGCDFGVFQFNAKQVSFSGSKGQIFAVSPSEAASIRPLYSNFRLSLSKKNYSLEFNTGHCSDSPSGLVCPEPDMTEQHIVVDYIAKTIQRLAH